MQKVSEASQLLWLENEGAILGRLVPVRKGYRSSRHQVLMAGETYMRWDRSCGVPIMTPKTRRLGTVSPENVAGLRAARLTRNERDAWERMEAWDERDDEIERANDQLYLAKTRNEVAEALERLNAARGGESQWLEEMGEHFARLHAAYIHVAVTR